MFIHSTHINTLVANGLSHPYHLDESTFISMEIRSYFSFLFHFSMKNTSANRIASDGTSHLGLFCLPMSHKRMPDLYRLRTSFNRPLIAKYSVQFGSHVVRDCHSFSAFFHN